MSTPRVRCLMLRLEPNADRNTPRGRRAPAVPQSWAADPLQQVCTEQPPKSKAQPALTAEEVYREHGPRVYRVAWRMLANDADAEDVTQDVLLQVVRKLDTFRGESSLATWLHRITVNAALAFRRKRALIRERQTRDPLDQLLADGAAAGPVRPWSVTPDEQVLNRELRQLIDGAIDGLPSIYRDVYVLGDVEGLANAEIGGRLDLSLPAVKSRLHRARLMMRDVLAPHFEEARA